MTPQRESDNSGGTIALAPQGISSFPLPPANFDPLVETGQLASYGLPTPNAMASNPLAAAFRSAFLQPRADGTPLRFVEALPAPPPDLAFVLVAIGAIKPQPQQKSVNWSGGYIAPRGGHSFASVMAQWTVPVVSAPSGGREPEYHSSTWIGLDGQKCYLDSSLPQIGTKQRCTTGTAAGAKYYAWFQWWARGQETREEKLGLPVDAGDLVSAIITVYDQESVICNMKNVSQGIMLQAFRAFAPKPCRISGATAEWIMERPSPPNSDGWDAYPLPAYLPFAFTDCVAETQPPGSAALHDRTLERASLIRMNEITTNPTGVRTISTAGRTGDPARTLEMTYVGP